MNPFAQLFEMLISIYVSIILLRFFLQYFRADYYNPLSQFIVKATDPLVKPVRRIIPGLGGLDLSTLLVAWLVIVLKYTLVIGFNGQWGQIGILPLFLFSLINLLESVVGLFIFLIIIRVIMSWVAPQGGYNPVFMVIGQLTEPMMARARNILPPMGGFDLSPMILLILLFFINSSISYYLYPLVSKLAN